MVPHILTPDVRARWLHERFTAVLWNDLVLVSVYLQPRGRGSQDAEYKRTLDDLSVLLQQWKDAYQWSHLMIGGDFNTHLPPMAGNATGPHVLPHRGVGASHRMRREQLLQFCGRWKVRAANTWQSRKPGACADRATWGRPARRARRRRGMDVTR